MKQKISSFLSNCEKDIYDVCNYLYNNPEISYKEYNSSKFLCDILRKYDFEVNTNFTDIDNSFLAKKGDGHPKICYLCEYDAIEYDGHITGHNVVSAISIAASLALGHIIESIGGSVILIGCPGEYMGGSKGMMVKEGVFEDVDVVMVAHPDISTYESGSSSAIIPLGVKFLGKKGLSFLNKNSFNTTDSALMTINIIDSLKKGLPNSLDIHSVICSNNKTPLLLPSETELRFYVRACDYKTAEYGDKLIRDTANFISTITGLDKEFFLYEYPNKEILTNKVLNRIFSHNLKEFGIINIGSPKNLYAGLSIGDVSHVVPCIHPYISIVEEGSTIKYGSKDFAKATISSFSLNQILIAAKALASTGIDLIENQNLLLEVKEEFFNTNSKL